MIDMERSTGVCGRCGERKSLSEFTKDSRKALGIGPACRTCEAARWRDYKRKNPERVKARRKAVGDRDRSDEMPSFDLAKPIRYQTAHQRVAYWRGRASIHECACGAPAQEWAYMHNCPYEQIGDGGGFVQECRYSPDPMAYVALCAPCHEAIDKWHAMRRRISNSSGL